MSAKIIVLHYTVAVIHEQNLRTQQPETRLIRGNLVVKPTIFHRNRVSLRKS
jgi:hypothetical protein